MHISFALDSFTLLIVQEYFVDSSSFALDDAYTISYKEKS